MLKNLVLFHWKHKHNWEFTANSYTGWGIYRCSICGEKELGQPLTLLYSPAKIIV